jgi:phage terminase large subunit
MLDWRHPDQPDLPAVTNGHAPSKLRSLDTPMGEKFVSTLVPQARHKALYGGRGSGKSWAVATYLIIEAGKSRKRIVCARQFQNSIRDSSKELIEKRIRDLGVEEQFLITDRSITCGVSGSEFLFMGLERNVESIRSLEGADIVWVEEARTISAKSMEVLLPTVRKAGSSLIWTWNPEQPTDPVDAYFRKGEKPPRSIVTFVDYRDNPYFKSTELVSEMEVLKNGNLARYKHVWLGEYDTKHESKVFPNVRIGRLIPPEDVPPRYGLDFGFGTTSSGDPSAIIKVYANDRKRQIYIAAEAVARVTMDQLPAMIRGVISDDADLIKADASQPGTIEFLQRRGLNISAAKKGPASVKSGIVFLQSYDIVIDPSCEHMREEARLYSWMTDKLTGQILSVPVDQHNHGWDAIRYAVEDVSLEGRDGVEDDTGGVLRLKLW